MTDSRRRWMSGLAVVVAGAAAFAFGSSLTPDPAEPSGRSVAIGAPSVGAEEGSRIDTAGAEISTTTTLAPTITTTTVAPRALSDSIRGWDYTLTWMTEGATGPVLARLVAAAAVPEQFELPRSAGQFAWNATATLVAYVDNRVLYVGPPGMEEPFAVDVQHVAWHQSDEHRIAWTENLSSVGNAPPVIVAATLSDIGVMLEAGVPLPIPDDGADGELRVWSLVAWGEDGFLVGRQRATTTQSDNEVRSDLLLLFDDGSLRRIFEERGVLLVRGESAATYMTQSGSSLGELLIIDLEGEERPIELDPGQELIALSRNGESWLAIGPGDSVAVFDGNAASTLPMLVTAAVWSDDGRYLVALGLSGESSVIDVASGAAVASSTATVGQVVWNLRVHSSGVGE